ncbi:MAG: hypothetical protein ABIP39_02430 [Polyangiaceae bacterium]
MLELTSPAAGTETVTRPDPGLGRGMWEGPRWLFFALAAIAVVVTAVYFLRRAGLLRIRRKGPAK